MNRSAETTTFRASWTPIGEDGQLELPAGAQVISLDFADGFGYGAGSSPIGAWYVTPTSEPLPPPSLP